MKTWFKDFMKKKETKIEVMDLMKEIAEEIEIVELLKTDLLVVASGEDYELIEKYINHKDSRVRKVMAYNGCASYNEKTEKMLTVLINDSNWKVRALAIGNTDITNEVFAEKLKTEKDWRVRAVLALKAYRSKEILEALANDSDCRVRAGLLSTIPYLTEGRYEDTEFFESTLDKLDSKEGLQELKEAYRTGELEPLSFG